MAKDDKIKVKTPPGRAVFEHLVTPRAKKQKGQDGKEFTADQWQVCMVFDEGTDLTEMKDAAREVARKAFGEHWQKLVQQGSIKWPFRDGGEIHPETGVPRFGENMVFINASSNNPVEVVSRYRNPQTGKARLLLNRKGEPTIDNVTDLIYPGVYMRAGVTIAPFNNESKGVAIFINTAQTLEYGDRLAQQASAEEEFADDLDDLPEAEMPMQQEDAGDVSSLL